jgi:hypothetical protein
MNQQPPKQQLNQLDQLDHVLVQEDALQPSSGFAASVMASIQEQAAAPAPIPFPWKRAVPGILALVVAFAILARLAGAVLRNNSQGSADFLPQEYLDFALSPAVRNVAGPILLALAASFVCVALCRRLAGVSSTR